ncbi:hypothetical protein GMORB2_3705 [Geosmithia morbida]|uniref:WD repeat protein n=1 Tax=Geosmithia morbida TaxID=1094350 RepID=A0A9P4YXF8_9HYPO|nr:uncharacterized protein GMORB2_3705 [Geosmithia morbida]KAF4124866.1 hypothetical protein GMORB2_3705 [Geosmithia morbida]
MYSRDSNIMRKLLGRTAPDTSAVDASHSAASIPPPVAYRPQRAQDAVYAAGVPISQLDVSPDRRSVALGGPHVLKTIVMDHHDDPEGDGPGGGGGSRTFAPIEGVDIRASIMMQPSVGPKANSVADQLNIRDVKWHGNSTVFTACASGRIFAYDIARLGTGSTDGGYENVHIQEDSRQVNTLDVNPHLQSWLLSGGQDGFARIFDTANPVHTRQGFVTFRQRFAGLRCIDPIRHVKWSPRVGHEMAACTDGGVVLKWDVRQPSKPLLRINAHEKACTGIAWHPDGVHLVSAGFDSRLHVWDMGSSADRRQKPKWTVNTPAPVAAVSWRPSMWSATAQARRVAQVAASYDDSSTRRYGTSAVHIWDLARPTMPYKEIERFDSSPSALSWQDQDILWTVGQDGMFNQCDVAYAPRAVDRQPTSALDFSSRGDVVMFLDERPQQPRLQPSSTAAMTKASSFASDSHTPMLSLSRSDSEEDVVGSFLAPRRRMHRKSRPSGRASATPPSSSSVARGKNTLNLEQSIKATGTFKPQQAMASGHIPAASSVAVYQYLSSVYLETLQRELPRDPSGLNGSLLDRIVYIMEQYARAAEGASLFRLAQTWRILSFTMTLLLKRRAQYHLETRLSRYQRIKHDTGRTPRKESYGAATQDNSTRLNRSHGPDRLSAAASDLDSTSNVATPLARPVDSSTAAYRATSGKMLTPIAEPESFSLGPNVQEPFSSNGERSRPRQWLNFNAISLASEDSDRSKLSITEGYDFYDMEALSYAVGLPIGPGEGGGRVQRHDSTDSYGQVFSISEGSRVAGSPKRHPSLQQSNTVGSDGSDYHSRIRGEELAEPRRNSKAHAVSDSPDDVFMISQATMRSGDYASYPSQPSYPSQDSESQLNQSAAVGTTTKPPPTIPPRHPHQKSPQMPPEYCEPSSTLIDSDYLPWPDDPEYPHPLTTSGFKASSIPPLDPYRLLARTLEFESRTSALNASAMVLLLRPLVAESVIDTFQATAILRQQHSRLSRMGLFTEAALMRKLCVRGWPAGLPSWGDNYPVIFAAAQRDVRVSLACSSCHRPREVDPSDPAASVWVCERCRAVMAPCAVCGHRDAQESSFDPIDSSSSSEIDKGGPPLLSGWWYCPGCTHGGHASCLETWHASDATSDTPAKFSEGCCPSDGCGHACLPGKYRGETTTARSEDLARAASDRFSTTRSGSGAASPRPGSSIVSSDGFEVPQSRAVGVAREALNNSANSINNSGAGGSSSSAGILSTSPGRPGPGMGERERRKSVKFARPDR